MKVCDLKKGDRVLLNYGEKDGDLAQCSKLSMALTLKEAGLYTPWEADVMAKPRGKSPIRVFLQVFGWEADIGDTYAHKILAAKVNGEWVELEHTDKEREIEKMERTVFG